MAVYTSASLFMNGRHVVIVSRIMRKGKPRAILKLDTNGQRCRFKIDVLFLIFVKFYSQSLWKQYLSNSP